MTPNRRDLEKRFDELRGDGDGDDELDELDEVERWRAFLRQHAGGGDGEEV